MPSCSCPPGKSCNKCRVIDLEYTGPRSDKRESDEARERTSTLKDRRSPRGQGKKKK